MSRKPGVSSILMTVVCVCMRCDTLESRDQGCGTGHEATACSASILNQGTGPGSCLDLGQPQLLHPFGQ